MKKYRLVVLVSGKLSDDEALAKIDELRGLINQASGKIESERVLGRKALAYGIKGETSGHFFESIIELEKETVQSLSHQLETDPAVGRHLIQSHNQLKAERQEKRLKRAEERAKERLESQDVVETAARQEKLAEKLEEIAKEA